jgi:gliding motility-associated-like protein
MGCDSLIITYVLPLPMDTTWLMFETCLTQDTGLVVSIFDNQYGCDSIVYQQTNLLPPSECALNVQIISDTIGCTEIQGSLLLTILNGVPPYQYNWTDLSGNSGTGSLNEMGSTDEINGLLPESYTIDISDMNGFFATVNGVVIQLEPLQWDLMINSDFNGYGISCYGENDGLASIEVISGGQPSYQYNWSNGSQNNIIENIGQGWFYVTVSDTRDCIAIDSFYIESPDNISFDAIVSQPDCFTEGLGSILVDQLSGGVGDYQFMIGQNGWQSNTSFENIQSGNYTLEIQDDNGCIVSAGIIIDSYTEPQVSLGDDITIEEGNSINIELESNLSLDIINSIYWEGANCDGCKSITVSPTETSIYTVTIIDEFGCEAYDEIQIIVNPKIKIIIPNIFSPNGDGVNDRFTIYSNDDLINIRTFIILDRWGDIVYSTANLPPNDPSIGWDGTFNGKKVEEGVYVYYSVVELSSGKTEIFKGDILLVR